MSIVALLVLILLFQMNIELAYHVNQVVHNVIIREAVLPVCQLLHMILILKYVYAKILLQCLMDNVLLHVHKPHTKKELIV